MADSTPIAVIQPQRMGDLILTYPVLLWLARSHPGRPVTVVADPAFARPLLPISPQAAFLSLARAVKGGWNAAVTPDGPRGPRYRAQPGIVTLAAGLTFTAGVKRVPASNASIVATIVALIYFCFSIRFAMCRFLMWANSWAMTPATSSSLSQFDMSPDAM